MNTFTEEARQLADPYWQGSFLHPFIQELQAGTLPMTVFRYYLLQDRYYLEHFGALYRLIAEKTDDPQVKTMMTAHAENLQAGEVAIRASFFQQLQITDEEINRTPIAPTAYHYVSHMYRQLIEGSVAAAVAGMLPCAWLYQEIGCRLLPQGSPQPLYQQWIETYGGEAAQAQIQQERALLDRLYATADQKEKQQMLSAFVISSQMEYLFWDMAMNLEEWPEGVQDAHTK